MSTFKQLPPFKILDHLLSDQKAPSLYGKFLVSHLGHFFIKLLTLPDWQKTPFFHDSILSDLGVKNPNSAEAHAFIQGGGHIAIETFSHHIEVTLFKKSTIYGAFDKNLIDQPSLTEALAHYFGCPVDHLLIQIQK